MRAEIEHPADPPVTLVMTLSEAEQLLALAYRGCSGTKYPIARPIYTALRSAGVQEHGA